MQAEKLTIEDGLMMRSLVDWPGGLELHIGVRGGGVEAGVVGHPLVPFVTLCL